MNPGLEQREQHRVWTGQGAHRALEDAGPRPWRRECS